MLQKRGTTSQDGEYAAGFTTTHWSVVLAAGKSDFHESQAALERLCRAYWYPLYAHVRRLGWNEPDAKDLTQQFFIRFVAGTFLKTADPVRGRFRSFLLASLTNFLKNEWEKNRAQKRGGNCSIVSWDQTDPEHRFRLEPVDGLTPELLYEKRWAAAVLESALEGMRRDYVVADDLSQFDALKVFVWGGANPGDYEPIARQLGVTEGAVKVAVHRMRKRFGEHLRREVARTVATPEDVESELRHLISVMGR